MYKLLSDYYTNLKINYSLYSISIIITNFNSLCIFMLYLFDAFIDLKTKYFLPDDIFILYVIFFLKTLNIMHNIKYIRRVMSTDKGKK